MEMEWENHGKSNGENDKSANWQGEMSPPSTSTTFMGFSQQMAPIDGKKPWNEMEFPTRFGVGGWKDWIVSEYEMAYMGCCMLLLEIGWSIQKTGPPKMLNRSKH